MKFFICLLERTIDGTATYRRSRYDAALQGLGIRPSWQSSQHAHLMIVGDDSERELHVARYGSWIGVGRARVDNRPELTRWVQGPPSELSDLALILRLVAEVGSKCIQRVLGDFSVVLWKGNSRTGLAARDAMGIRKLYYVEDNDFLALSDRAEALRDGGNYSAQFLTEVVAACDPSADLTVYEGVKQLPPGAMLKVTGRRLGLEQYWSPEAFAPPPGTPMREDEAALTLRELLVEAVRARLSDEGRTWAQLSGGLDSSSVVSTTQWLVENGLLRHGLAATVTYVDREDTAADERSYSSAITTRWGLHNHPIVSPPLWYDDRYPPPRLDQPRQNFIFYPREYRLAEIVRANGGRVLLTGQGPDEYLRGSMFFFADWVVQGRVWQAVREMARRASLGRVSFWDLAYRNAVVPLMPRVLRLRLRPEGTRFPPWVRPEVVRRYGLQERLFALATNAGPLGSKYHHKVVTGLQTLTKVIGHLVLDDLLDVRHPFMDRRLVEFALRLPPELTVRPYQGKWVLRQAMKGILPEVVRLRVGKGSLNERHAWSLSAQRPLLEPLVLEPLLGDLGVVDPLRLRTAFESAPNESFRRDGFHSGLQQVLAVEAWLQLRAGRWPSKAWLGCSCK